MREDRNTIHIPVPTHDKVGALPLLKNGRGSLTLAPEGVGAPFGSFESSSVLSG